MKVWKHCQDEVVCGGRKVSTQISHTVPLATPLFIRNIPLGKFPSPQPMTLFIFLFCVSQTQCLMWLAYQQKCKRRDQSRDKPKWSTEGAKPCHLGLINIRLQLAVLAALPTPSLSPLYNSKVLFITDLNCLSRSSLLYILYQRVNWASPCFFPPFSPIKPKSVDFPYFCKFSA